MKQRKDAIVDYQALRNENGGYDCACKTCGKVENVSKQTLYRRLSGTSVECKSCAQKRIYPEKESLRIAQKAYAKSIRMRPLDKPHRNELRAWAVEVHKSWNYTCAMCGSGKRLEAHHIIPQAYSPENALVVENGITLCYHCHKDMHKHLGPIRRPKVGQRGD